MEVATITLQVEIDEDMPHAEQTSLLNQLLSDCEEVIGKKGLSLYDSQWYWD